MAAAYAVFDVSRFAGMNGLGRLVLGVETDRI
jgi:hypothetical protein